MSRNRRSRRLGVDETRTVVFPFRVWLNDRFGDGSHLNGSVNTLTLNPGSLGNRATATSLQFEHWRLNKLKLSTWFSVHPVSVWTGTATSGITDGVHGFGFTTMDSSKFSSVPTWAQLTQFPIFEMKSAPHIASCSVQTQELRKTTVPWLETTSTGSESQAFRQAGTVFWGAWMNSPMASGLPTHLLVEGEIEFRDPVDAAITATTGVAPPSGEEKQAVVPTPAPERLASELYLPQGVPPRQLVAVRLNDVQLARLKELNRQIPSDLRDGPYIDV
jgi:hypothetical protein